MKIFGLLLILIAFGILVAGMTGCSNDTPPRPSVTQGDTVHSTSGGVFKTITADEAHAYMAEHDPAEYVILDVRTQEEFDEGYIQGAILLPDTELAAKAATVLPDKAKPVLIYCRSGRRSANSAALLASMGYENVYDFGGIIDWTFEVVK